MKILLLDIDSTSVVWFVIVAINFVWGFIIGGAISNIRKTLQHSRAHTKLLSLMAIDMGIDMEDVNAVVQEIEDENPMLFEETTVEE